MTSVTIPVDRDVQSAARSAAATLRRRLGQQGTFVVNLLSSPGSGKTALLEATAQHWRGRRSLGVLVGDLATDRDAQRLRPLVPVVQLTTGGACHLELPLVERGLRELGEQRFEFLFMENVGNLVCPASHDLGEHVRVILLSVTEGDDKPGKYPKAFRSSQALVISKLDLLPHVPFSVSAAVEDARRIQPNLTALPLCALSAAGVDAWCSYLDAERQKLLATGHDVAIR